MVLLIISSEGRPLIKVCGEGISVVPKRKTHTFRTIGPSLIGNGFTYHFIRRKRGRRKTINLSGGVGDLSCPSSRKCRKGRKIVENTLL